MIYLSLKRKIKAAGGVALAKRLGGLLVCFVGRQLQDVADRLMNLTAFLFNDRLLPVIGSGVRISVPNFNFTVPVRVEMFVNNSLIPALERLVSQGKKKKKKKKYILTKEKKSSSNMTIGSSRAAEALSLARMLLSGMKIVLEALVQLGDCNSGLMRQLQLFIATEIDGVKRKRKKEKKKILTDSNKVNYCQNITWGISMSVWGSFTAAIAVFFGTLTVVIGSPLMGMGTIRAPIGVVLILDSIACNLSLLLALVAFFAGAPGDIVTPLSLVLFFLMCGSTALIMLPLHWWSTKKKVQMYWASSALLAFCQIGLAAGLLGSLASKLVFCWTWKFDECVYQCSNMDIAILSLGVAISSIILIASLVQITISIILAAFPTVKLQFHDREPEMDWDAHAIKLN